MRVDIDIKDVPCRIIEAMLFNQREQGNKTDIMVFKDSIDACVPIGGFDWCDTNEGSDFWHDILFEGNFDLFFDDENKDIVKDLTLPYEIMRIEMAKIYRHYVTEDLAAIPTRIIDKMMEEQVAQGNVANVSVFDNELISFSSAGGFDWDSTNEGEDFWHDVLIEHDFDLFDSVFSSEEKDKPIKKQTPSDPNIDDKAYPEEIERKMIYYQVYQGNKADITVFYKDCYASQYNGGFDWCDTKEGYNFWEKIILHRDYSEFYERERLKSMLGAALEATSLEMASDESLFCKEDEEAVCDCKDDGFEVAEYSGAISGFPKEADVRVFEEQADANCDNYGFDWESDSIGYDYWMKLIHRKNYAPISQCISDMNHTPAVCTADANIERAKNNIDQYYTLKERLDGLKKSIEETEEKLSSLICDRDECENKINEIKKQFK